MYKAVFLDMDGTLLRTDHSVSEPTQSAIRKLVARGIPVILVSARPLNAILPTAGELGLLDYPIVTLNGGYIVEGEKPVFQAIVDLATTAKVTAEVRPFKATIAYYLQTEWYSEINDPWTAHEQKIMDVLLKVAPIDELISNWSARHTGPNKMMVMGEPENIQRIQEHLKSLFGESLNIYPSKPTYLEVMEPQASKANALRFLIERMKLGRTEIIAMGDNYNDKEMIRFAGTGVAMGNAPDEIKAVADYVTDTNNNDGVLKALQHFFGDLGI